MALVVGALLPSCGEDAQVVARQVRDFIQNVQTGDGQTRGALVEGAAPEPSGGPTPSSDIGSATVITGGTSPITITSGVPFATIILLVGGAEDYYEVNLPAPTGSAEILLTYGQDVPQAQFDAVYTVVDVQGRVGQYIATNLNVARVAGGDVQVTVSWDSPSDVDLAVIGPDAERIAFSHRTGDNGATLSVDSNSGCTIDNINNESITYPAGRAPSGLYTVEIRLFDNCDTISTEWVATVVRDGVSEPLVMRGAFESVATDPGGPTPPVTGQGDPNLSTFTFEFPVAGVETCDEGFVFDPETNQCEPAGGLCDQLIRSTLIGTSCEIAGALCADEITTCSDDLVCTTPCQLSCANRDCPSELPVCGPDEGPRTPLCGAGAAVEQAPAYEECGTTTSPQTCEAPSRCLGLTGLEAVATPFCSPPCVDNVCPSFQGVAGACGLGEDGGATPTRCVLVCNPASPICPTGQNCQAVQDSGICVWPLSQ